MARASDIEAVVFDVLGTMVDEPGGLRAAIRNAVPASDDTTVDQLLTVWQDHVGNEQQRIDKGDRAYANSEVIDREAAQQVAARAGLTDPAAIERLATAGQRMKPWGDSPPDSPASPGDFPYSGSPTPAVRLCSGSTHTPGCAGTKPSPPRTPGPTSPHLRSTGSHSTRRDAHRNAY